MPDKIAQTDIELRAQVKEMSKLLTVSLAQVKAMERRLFTLEQNTTEEREQNLADEIEYPSRQVLESYFPILPRFSGVAYVMGKKTTGLNSDVTKPYVKCVRSTLTATEVAAIPSDPFPDDEEYYEKVNTYGDIHAFSH